MAIKDLIFLKQRKSAIASVVSAYRSPIAYLTAASNDKLLFTGSNSVFVSDYNGVVQLALDAPAGASISVYPSCAVNGDFLFSHYTGTYPNRSYTVVRLNTSGAVWSKQFPAGVQIDSIAESPDGSIVIAGSQRIGGALEDVLWLFKLSGSTGALTWAKKHDSVTALRRAFTPSGIAVDSAGSIYVTGAVNYPDSFDTRYGVAKFTSAGALSWSKTHDMQTGGADCIFAHNAIVTSTGSVYATLQGSYQTTRIVQYNPSTGATIQSKTIQNSTTSMDKKSRIFETPDGLKIAYAIDSTGYGTSANGGGVVSVSTSLVPSSAIKLAADGHYFSAPYKNSLLVGANTYDRWSFRLKSGLTFPTEYKDSLLVPQINVTAEANPIFVDTPMLTTMSIGGTISNQTPTLVNGAAYSPMVSIPVIELLYSTGGTF